VTCVAPTNAPPEAAPAVAKKAEQFLLAVVGNSITIDQPKNNAVDLELAAVAFDAGHRNAATTSQGVSTNLDPALAQKILATSLGINQRLYLAPGAYQVKFAVRDNPTGQLGTITVPSK
jgi:hypothetical protein